MLYFWQCIYTICPFVLGLVFPFLFSLSFALLFLGVPPSSP
jgi:hypothetical protein